MIFRNITRALLLTGYATIPDVSSTKCDDVILLGVHVLVVSVVDLTLLQRGKVQEV